MGRVKCQEYEIYVLFFCFQRRHFEVERVECKGYDNYVLSL